jgi:Ca2+-binding EF-hand superfamily protein
MLLALGAASSAIDSLLGLTSSKQAQPAGSGGQNQPNLFAFQADATSLTGSTAASTSGGCSSISPETMSALLAAQSQASQGASVAPTSREDALKDLFSQIDADGDGKITKSEFENALGAGGSNLAAADDVFGKLDKNGDGSVSLGEMSSALKGGHGHHFGHHHMADASSDFSDPLSQALQGTSSTTVTNADGSTTTSLTYADGSKVTMTTPAASSASGASNSATSSYNFIEQLIQRQANLISSQASSSLSVSV